MINSIRWNFSPHPHFCCVCQSAFRKRHLPVNGLVLSPRLLTTLWNASLLCGLAGFESSGWSIRGFPPRLKKCVVFTFVVFSRCLSGASLPLDPLTRCFACSVQVIAQWGEPNGDTFKASVSFWALVGVCVCVRACLQKSRDTISGEDVPTRTQKKKINLASPRGN